MSEIILQDNLGKLTLENRAFFRAAKVFINDTPLKFKYKKASCQIDGAQVSVELIGPLLNPYQKILVNNVEHELMPELRWFEKIICLMPMLFIVLGGALGGGIGVIGLNLNLCIFRSDGDSLGRAIIALLLLFVLVISYIILALGINFFLTYIAHAGIHVWSLTHLS